MRSYRALCCALSLLIAAAPAVAAQKKPAAKKAPPGRTETLACRLGTEDRHARIAVVVIRGKTDSFAYYSKWKPRTCSIYLQRNRDPYSKWADNGAITTVNLEKGAFLIEHKPGEYHFIFRDIDRERYCGMDGVINGSLTIKRGSPQCVLDGDIMVEGLPLGEVQAHLKEPEGPLAPDAAAAGATPAATAPAAGAPAATAPAAAAPAATTSPAASPAASPTTGSAPVTSPAATAPTAAPEAASDQAPAAATGSAPAAASVEQAPTAQQPAAADTAGSPPATCCEPGAQEKPAEAPSTNPFSAFFRSLRPQAPDEQMP